MKIQMPAITGPTGNVAAAVKKEGRLLRKADSIFVSSFKLRLSPNADVQKYELGVLLTTARSNPRYKSNAANYQFKLKSDSQGQYLTLKQQGWWSSFKGMFGRGREVREQQRTAAMDLINSRLGIGTQPTGPISLGPNDRLNFANAKSYQVNVFEDMGLGPSARGSNSEEANLRPSARGSNNETLNTQDLKDFLHGNSAFLKEDAPQAVASFVNVDPDSTGQKPASKTQLVMPHDGNGEAGRKNSLVRDPTVEIDPADQPFAQSLESSLESFDDNSYGNKEKGLADILKNNSFLVKHLLGGSFASEYQD